MPLNETTTTRTPPTEWVRVRVGQTWEADGKSRLIISVIPERGGSIPTAQYRDERGRTKTTQLSSLRRWISINDAQKVTP